MKPNSIFWGIVAILFLLVCAYGIYTYSDLKHNEREANQKTDSLLVELGKQLQVFQDLQNQARPIETRYIEQKTVYKTIQEKVKGLKATERTKALHEGLKKFEAVDERGTKW